MNSEKFIYWRGEKFINFEMMNDLGSSGDFSYEKKKNNEGYLERFDKNNFEC